MDNKRLDPLADPSIIYRLTPFFQNNPSMGILDPAIRERVAQIAYQLLGGV